MTGQTLTITTPLALNRTRSATLTAPWFVQKTEYNPAQATFQPLVNGEEAFCAVWPAPGEARTRLADTKRVTRITVNGSAGAGYARDGDHAT